MSGHRGRGAKKRAYSTVLGRSDINKVMSDFFFFFFPNHYCCSLREISNSAARIKEYNLLSKPRNHQDMKSAKCIFIALKQDFCMDRDSFMLLLVELH